MSFLSSLLNSYPERLSSIRFRKAWVVQGHSIEELPFQAMGGVWGSWFGVVLIVLVLIAQFYVVSVIFHHHSLSVNLIAFCHFRQSGALVEWQKLPNSSLKDSSVSSLSFTTQQSLILITLLFSESYLAFPVMIAFYAAGYYWKRTLPQRSHEIDLDVRSFVLHFLLFLLTFS